jgi:2,3-bisphosphoglycerate-independent phosphoglycerate mutase
LVILDGFGERAEREDNAVRLARSPALDSIFSRYPHGLLGASGPDVGLPPGQMGNSEVGHLNFGAGRIALMDITRIDAEIEAGTLGENPVLRGLATRAAASGTRLHLLGLVSDGGVHSSMRHLSALIDVAHGAGARIVLHAFLDGRDVQPGTAPRFLSEAEQKLKGASGILGTVSGRYWAMDRDNRWERVEKAYRAIVAGEGPRAASAIEGVEHSYAAGKTDEFVEPFVVGDYRGVAKGDCALHFNFRPDRARELTRALALADSGGFARGGAPPFEGAFACMTTYDASFGLPIAYPKESHANIFPEVIARAGYKQFRCAETEKYAHVTYFFNGGREQPFDGEDRKMIPSPKDVPTYDLEPQMAAAQVTQSVVEAVRSGRYDFVLVNFANPDMVGHTGSLDAAIHAVEAVDAGVGAIVEAARESGGAVIITADHGNCELMKDPATGKPHTAHTLNPVPIAYVNDRDPGARLLPSGRLSDVAPTMLELLGLSRPSEMTGHSLLQRA